MTTIDKIARTLERMRKDPKLAGSWAAAGHPRVAAFVLRHQRQGKARTYRFLPTNMTGKYGGPWREGEKRTVAQPLRWWWDFNSSPTLWEALRYAMGPVACLFEVSGYQEIQSEREPREGVSNSCQLIAAGDVSHELRQFAADCAERALRVFEQVNPEDRRPRRAYEAARALADGAIDEAEARAESVAARISMSVVSGHQRSEECALHSVVSAVEADAATAAREAAFWAANTASCSWAFSPSEFQLPTAAENIFVHALTTSQKAKEAERDWQAKHFDEIMASTERWFSMRFSIFRAGGDP